MEMFTLFYLAGLLAPCSIRKPRMLENLQLRLLKIRLDEKISPWNLWVTEMLTLFYLTRFLPFFTFCEPTMLENLKLRPVSLLTTSTYVFLFPAGGFGPTASSWMERWMGNEL